MQPLSWQGSSGHYIPLDVDLSVLSDNDLFELIQNCISNTDSLLVGLVNNAFTFYPQTALSVDTNSVHCAAELSWYSLKAFLGCF